MKYLVSKPFRGDADAALGLAQSALTALGFRIVERSHESLKLLGPGLNSSRQSALLGATDIRIQAARGSINLEADLGGVRRMSRFVMTFPLGLIVGLGALIVALFAVVFGPGRWITTVAIVVGVNVAIWLVLAPAIRNSIRSKTERALDTLAENMVSVGESVPAA